eukprot:6397910-Amphidinium_carterae.1
MVTKEASYNTTDSIACLRPVDLDRGMAITTAELAGKTRTEEGVSASISPVRKKAANPNSRTSPRAVRLVWKAMEIMAWTVRNGMGTALCGVRVRCQFVK